MSISQRSHLPSVHYVASSRRHKVVTGRTSFELFVFASAVRTKVCTRKNPCHRLNNQRHLGTVLSTTRTRSFTAKFRLFSSQLWRCCKVGTCSRIHLDQKQSAINWACLHCLREYISSLAKTPGGTKRFRRRRRRWFGVSGSLRHKDSHWKDK